MNDTSVSRTLVKSPPELWSEVSDLESLAEHLGEFGEISITRLEAESTVAWEGESASGTVALEPTAWGTKVTLTASPITEPGAEPAEPEADAEPVVEPEAVAEPEPEAAAPEPESPTAETTAAPPRRGRFAFWRRRKPVQAPEAPAVPAAPEPEPVATAEPEPEVEPEPGPTPFDRQAMAVLSGALDALGAARHRPFSRG